MLHRGWSALLGVVAVLAAESCGETAGICMCPAPLREVGIDLGCVPAVAPTVKTTGPCEVCPPALADGRIPEGSHCALQSDSKEVLILSNAAGTCHVEVSVGDGPTSSIDVKFASKWMACNSDPHGCGEAFLPVTPDGGLGPLTLPEPVCSPASDAGM
jgi:hypothetical protein